MIIFSGQALVFRTVNFFTDHFYENSSAKKIVGLLESDIFVRKRSPFFHAVNSDLKKHNIAFWEETEDDLKMVIYNIQIDQGEKINKLSRYVLSQGTNPEIFSNKNSDENNVLNMIENGIYFLPSYKWSLLDLSNHAKEAFFTQKDSLYCLTIGDLDFYSP